MITAKFNANKLSKTINNIIKYSDGYISETKRNKHKIMSKMANTSINVFYEYLDGVARLHPTMLHHIYEWGEVGSPLGRLVELNMRVVNESAEIGAEFLQSTTIPSKGKEPFYDKAEIMEMGESVIVTEDEANALFFEVDGEEIFRKGPIVIPNPGGEAVRGSFVKVFNEFYGNYFSQVYLRSIKFYKHLEEMRAYQNNIKAAAKSPNPRTLGRNSALQWISTLPGDDLVAN